MRTFKTIGYLFLALSMLVATSGITLNKHYCMGRLKSVAIFHHAENCSGTDEKDPMPCCEDISEELKLNEITTISFDFDAQPDLFEISVVNFQILPNTHHEVLEDLTAFSLPPPKKIDYQIDNQVFLI